MIRYLVSLVILLGGLVLGLAMTGMKSAILLLDLPSFLIVGIFPFLYISALYGFRDTASAFSVSFKKENTRDDLNVAFTFFQKYGQTTWVMSLISIIIGTIQVLAHFDDRAAIESNVALALFSLFYSGLINVLLVIPFTLFIKKQMNG